LKSPSSPAPRWTTALAAQKAIFNDKKLAKAIGLKFCGGCYSGLDLIIKQKFETIVQPG
jgi:hypothetical protein